MSRRGWVLVAIRLELRNIDANGQPCSHFGLRITRGCDVMLMGSANPPPKGTEFPTSGLWGVNVRPTEGSPVTVLVSRLVLTVATWQPDRQILAGRGKSAGESIDANARTSTQGAVNCLNVNPFVAGNHPDRFLSDTNPRSSDHGDTSSGGSGGGSPTTPTQIWQQAGLFVCEPSLDLQSPKPLSSCGGVIQETDPHAPEPRPNHVIAFIRPKPRQPPNLATFVVPLQFHKFDLRDYLFHAYNVEVTSVRSFINQPAPRQKYGNVGKWYRPRSQKMMIVELVKPFVWPEAPAEDDRADFDHDMFQKIENDREKQMKRQMDPATIPLRTRQAVPDSRKTLKRQAAGLLESGEWSSGQKPDEKWTEVEEEVSV